MRPLIFLFLAFSINAMLSGQSTETKLSSGIGFDGEPNMAVNPSNPRHMVVAWMSLGLSGTGTVISIKTRTTFDGGQTWSTAVALPHFAAKWGSADPTMAFHRGGKLYLAYIDYRQAVDSGGVYLFSSSNGGLSWNYESQIIDATESAKLPLDRPWLVVDNSGTATDGTLYVTTKPAPWIPAPNRPYLKVSSDGKNWSATRFVDTTGFLVGNFIQAPMASPGVTKGGKFVAAYPSYVASQSIYAKMYLANSTSKGTTFSYTSVLTNKGGSGDTNLKSGYLLLPHPSNDKYMVFAYLDNAYGDADITLTHSNDGGVTWSPDVRVNDDTAGNGKLQDLVWANWGDKGNLALCWRDRRNGSGKGVAQSSDCYCAVSTDSGKTFQKNLRMTAQSAAFNNVLYQNGNDFMSCALNGDTLCAVWGDVRSNKLEIWLSSIVWKQNTNAVQKLLVSEDLPPLHVWPVPASNELHIHCIEKLRSSEIKIMDVHGKIIKTISLNNTETIDISGLKNGIYFLIGNTHDRDFSQVFEVLK